MLSRQSSSVLQFACIALLVLAYSFVLAPDKLPGAGLCWFNQLSGLPCPGCGLTRAFCAISHGRFQEAWAFNPFAFLFYPLCVGIVLFPLFRRQWPAMTKNIMQPRTFSIAVPLLVLAMYAFGICRIALGGHGG